MSAYAPAQWPSDYGIDEKGEEELEDELIQQKDVILFAIEATESMLRVESSDDEETKTCKLVEALKVVHQLMRKKIISNPRDRIGVMIYNTEQGSKTDRNQWKSCQFLNDLSDIDAPAIKNLKNLIQKCESDERQARSLFEPRITPPNQIHEALRAALNRFKECVPKQASKRIFWITDNCAPLSADGEEAAKHYRACMTVSKDLSEMDVHIIPFFIHNETTHMFNTEPFYKPLLQYHASSMEANSQVTGDGSHDLNLAERFQNLLHHASTRECQKRSLFKIPFKLGEGLEIGINGFALVVEEKRRAYTWVDPHGSTLEEVKVISEHRDAQSTAVVPSHEIVSFVSIGDSKEPETVRKVIFKKDELERIRTLNLSKGLTLLGFRPQSELEWKHHLKHSYFIFPNEDMFRGSMRTFSALVQSMVKKGKIGYGVLRARKGDTPALVAMLPQLESYNEETQLQVQPCGLHLCILPWADDMRPLTVNKPLDVLIGDETELESEALQIAKQIVKRLKVGYVPNNIRNPGLNYHYDYLAAKCFNEPFVQSEDQSLPWYQSIQDRCGSLIAKLNAQIDEDPRAGDDYAVAPTESSSNKRKLIEGGEGVDVEVIKSAFAGRKEKGLLVRELKDFLIFKRALKSGGKVPLKPELIELARKVVMEEQDEQPSSRQDDDKLGTRKPKKAKPSLKEESDS